MRPITRVLEYGSRSEEFRLYPLGDTHIGHAGAREDALRMYVDRIAADPLAYWIGMGDYIDCVQRSDPRYDVRETAPWMTLAMQDDTVAAQRDRFLALTQPIWHKCLAMCKGNHEDAVRRHYERDVYGEILHAIGEASPWCTDVDGLGRPTGSELAFGYTGILRLLFRRRTGAADGKHKTFTLPIFLHHGFGGGRLKGAKALNLQRVAGQFDVGLIIMGHSHDEIIEPLNRVGVNQGGKLVNTRIMSFVSGTFLESWSETGAAYIERAGYPPGSIGTSYVVVRPGMMEDAPLVERERVQVVS